MNSAQRKVVEDRIALLEHQAERISKEIADLKSTAEYEKEGTSVTYTNISVPMGTTKAEIGKWLRETLKNSPKNFTDTDPDGDN